MGWCLVKDRDEFTSRVICFIKFIRMSVTGKWTAADGPSDAVKERVSCQALE